jgi:hypothetical protein
MGEANDTLDAAAERVKIGRASLRSSRPFGLTCIEEAFKSGVRPSPRTPRGFMLGSSKLRFDVSLRARRRSRKA